MSLLTLCNSDRFSCSAIALSILTKNPIVALVVRSPDLEACINEVRSLFGKNWKGDHLIQWAIQHKF
ncbi:hypothetical protein PN435_20360 [Nodularia spumigena CS-590/02]|nr:hypothetical protein [Nodularia spumigena]MDB9317607.1 hypothetical protein [Nodularia spumigena CS-590/01A]MDB9328487.1 hypothetical protein [Nodularia spumigena CS-590/02]MDB9337212.1 hypothetical protein [Nodularia spumigena CS-590/01]